uniref:Uncharacterized protein n=1 Tax=Triticum urartu TaxID=4572 RepID=A0A8R7U3E4_TRIUA
DDQSLIPLCYTYQVVVLPTLISSRLGYLESKEAAEQIKSLRSEPPHGSESSAELRKRRARHGFQLQQLPIIQDHTRVVVPGAPRDSVRHGIPVRHHGRVPCTCRSSFEIRLILFTCLLMEWVFGVCAARALTSTRGPSGGRSQRSWSRPWPKPRPTPLN